MYEGKFRSVFKESAVTLRSKSTFSYSFSRANRFRSQKRGDNVEFVCLPSTLDRRGTSQGLGERWGPRLEKGFESPAPGTYDLPSCFNMKIGPKFIKQRLVKNREFDLSPGPGSYECTVPFGKFAPKFTIRPKIFNYKFRNSPPPDAYSPMLITNNAFKNITFGIGERKYLKTPKDTSPGPGSYEVGNTFLLKKEKKL